MKLIYGKKDQLNFTADQDVYIAIGFLANCNQIRIYEEPNKQSGAYADEWRISFSEIPVNTPQSIKDSIKSNANGSNHRLNNKEFINDLLKNVHSFQLGNVQDVISIRNTIPAGFISDFENGLSL